METVKPSDHFAYAPFFFTLLIIRRHPLENVDHLILALANGILLVLPQFYPRFQDIQSQQDGRSTTKTYKFILTIDKTKKQLVEYISSLSSDEETLWQIPIRIITSSWDTAQVNCASYISCLVVIFLLRIDFSYLAKKGNMYQCSFFVSQLFLVTERESTVQLDNVKATDWVRFNAGQTGMFRCCYEPALLVDFQINQAHSTKSSANLYSSLQKSLSAGISDKTLPPIDRLGMYADANIYFAPLRSQF